MSGYRGGYRGRNNNYSNQNRNQSIHLSDDERRLVNQGRDELFHKKKNFPMITSLKDPSLLLRENLFTSDKWNLEELMNLKERLNETRNRLNEKDIKVWKQHTGKTNMTGRVVWALRDQNRIEMCTNAWIKMAEIFCQYEALIPKDLPEDQPFRSVHVCEAPGAFICATNFYYRQTYERRDSRSPRRQWDWTGLSLNPYYEGNDQEAMVDDDRFIVETLDKWYFGVDNSGNILKTDNIEGLWKKVRAESRSTGVHLVTGDGSVDTSGDPNEQESIVAELHYTEAVCAMGALAKGGSLVLKMFSLFECETVCLLYILALHFKELSIFKPASSRAPNGETYAVALGFRGIDPQVLGSLLSFVSPTFPSGKALLSRASIPQSFLDALVEIAAYFTQKQVQALERNLNLEKIWNRDVQNAIFQLNQDVVKEFRQQCRIDFRYQQSVPIVKTVQLDGSAKSLGNSASLVKGGLRQRSGGTLYDRQDKKRAREEFLLKDDSNKNRDNNEDDDGATENRDEQGSNKRRNLGQGKTITVGSKNLVKVPSADDDDDDDTTSAMDTSASNSQQQQSTGESLAMRMMKKLGYEEGKGLGAQGQGRSTPIETVMLNNRLGLGHHNQASTGASASSFIPHVIDEPLFSSYDQPISTNVSLPPLDRRSVTVAAGLHSVLSSLFVKFDDLETLYKKREEYYEKIAGGSKRILTELFISDQLEVLNGDETYRDLHGIFVHFSTAFQLASLNKLFQLTTMHLHDATRLSFIIDNVSLSGFAEYLIWQQQDQVDGIVISDLKSSFPASASVRYKTHLDSGHPRVHLFFSDLSLSRPTSKTSWRYIEQYNKHRMLTACRQALTTLAANGHFICKLTDTLTRFTTGLIYLLYCSFKSICVLRPFTLDPANPERFVVCLRLKSLDNVSIVQHLDALLKVERAEEILEVVPLKCLLESQFQQYIADVSQRLLQREVQALEKRLWSLAENNADEQVDSTVSEEDWKEAHDCVTVYRRPQALPTEPDSGIRLPLGWTKEWSKREERFYYFHIDTKSSQWEPPN